MNLFVFGATGDLVKRKLLPALNEMNLPNLRINAIGRRDYLDSIYKEYACGSDCRIRDKINYFKANIESGRICKACFNLLKKDEINYFYVSLPPHLYKFVIRKIKNINSFGFKTRIIFEKPFGVSLQNAKEIYKMLEKYSLVDDSFISDHYLFKESIIKLKKPRFEKSFEFYALEEIGLEGRITYYDSVGALKDMVQSHMLNVLFKFLSEKEIKSISVVDYKKKQYKDYCKELGKKSNTETYVEVKLKVGEKSILLVTGKKLPKKETKLVIDGKTINVIDNGAYQRMLSSFFLGEKEKFPSFENTMLAWELVEKIASIKTSLEYY